MGGTETPIQSSADENSVPLTLPPLSADEKAAKGRKTKPTVTQAEPTAPRARDPETGLELDEYGLPISGPARKRWLADARIDDPALTGKTENPNG